MTECKGFTIPREILEPRFWAKVNKTNSCWLWIGTKSGKGYGRMWRGDRVDQAHRIAYELFVGPIPKGLTIDHMCRVRACVNPEHLRPMTLIDNIMASVEPYCRNGHEYTEGSFYLVRDWRICKICKKKADKSYIERNWERIMATRRDAWHRKYHGAIAQ